MAKTTLNKAKEESITIEQAAERLKVYVRKPFGELFTKEQLKNIKTNKGLTGQLAEFIVGKPLDNAVLDFIDGELKLFSFKTNKHNKIIPASTIAICQISSEIDTYLINPVLENTRFGKKSKRVIFLPVCKNGDVSEWFFANPIIICIDDPEHLEKSKEIATNFYDICDKMSDIAENGKQLHTITPVRKDEKGEIIKPYIQVRTKSSRRKDGTYTPVYSKAYNRELASKGYAFYYTSRMTKYLASLITY